MKSVFLVFMILYLVLHPIVASANEMPMREMRLSEMCLSEMRMAVTTSFYNSGLSDMLLPEIKKDTGLDVRLLVVGTGQALKLGRSGDVDAVFVHSKEAEEVFVRNGYGMHRREIMYSDFILAGPAHDPAKVGGSGSVVDALQKIRTKAAMFVSRGDDSGTHKKELSLWRSIALNAVNFNTSWYREVGAGMGAALNIASGMDAYILTDRASWLNFANKENLRVLFSGDPLLFNQYAFIPVNSARHSHVDLAAALCLEAWLAGSRGQQLIGSYEIKNERPFVPNAMAKP